MHEGARQKYCQLTHPERIHRYLRKWPGLLECSRANASVLALYAPQLTIRGFDDDLADVFDELLTSSYQDSLQFFSYSNPDTFDGKEPLCGEAIAWRHLNSATIRMVSWHHLLSMHIPTIITAAKCMADSHALSGC